MLKKFCESCKAEYSPRHKGSRFCSRPCLWKTNGKSQVKQPFVWWVNSRGYMEGRVTENGITRRMKYHRWIMEQELGYRLPLHVDVHHLDENKLNNDPSNLQVIDHKRHTILTHTGKRRSHKWKLTLTDKARQQRSERAKQIGLDKLGRDAIAKAEGR